MLKIEQYDGVTTLSYSQKKSKYPSSQVLHNAFPRFAERGEGGGYQQQDANECWMEILRMLQVKKKFLTKI